MSDPLSVTAGVVSLVSLGLQTTEYLYKFYTIYRERDRFLARTTDRLGDLLRILQTVKDAVETRQWHLHEKDILQKVEDSISRCEQVIQELQKEIGQLENTAGRKTLDTVRRRVAYPFRRSTLEKLDEDVSELREHLSLTLQALQIRVQSNTCDDLEDIKSILSRTHAQNGTIKLRSWLNAPDVTVDFNAAASKRYPGTGRWFTGGDTFDNWLQDDNSFLWLYGFAGCGKSVLCSTAVQHAFRRQRAQPNSAIAFFFFTFNDELKQGTSALLRALLLQVSGQITGVTSELTRLEEISNHGTPPVTVLAEHLRQAINRSRHTYILIDALDECLEEDARAEVLDTIQMVRKWRLPSLHLLVTSRDILDIREALEPGAHEMVAFKNDDVKQDILHYVCHHIENDPRLRRWKEDRQIIKDYLVEQANGVFRWVQCQLEPLRRCPKSKYDLERCLRSLPRSLDETYERMLCNIDDSLRERAQRILALLCFSARELAVAEVIEALTVDVDGDECYDVNRKLEGSDDLLRICPGLIEIVTDSRSMPELEIADTDGTDGTEVSTYDAEATISTYLRIAHFSVQEYLVSDRIRSSRAHAFAMVGPVEHLRISKTCILYISHETFVESALTRDLVQRYFFARYAAQHWYHHYSHGDTNMLPTVNPWIVKLLIVERLFQRWVRLYDVEKRIGPSVRIKFDNEPVECCSAVYYAASLGLDSLLESKLLVSGIKSTAREGIYGSALGAAVANGHLQTVKILLRAEADEKTEIRSFRQALTNACLKGKEDIVSAMLDRPPTINSKEVEYMIVLSALHVASSNGHEQIVRMLLDWRVDVDMSEREYLAGDAKADGYDGLAQILLTHRRKAQGMYGRPCTADRTGFATISGNIPSLLAGHLAVQEIEA